MERIEICLCGMGQCDYCPISEQIERWEVEQAIREEYENNLERC